ncbi:MAG: hypothetical protein WBIAU1_03340 [Wolbachia endosymbiont of Drosophila biauraria]|nr:MAG: hypothetical protein WBIAU1_03340 [Wolbachia endosymbiont of Drosophila biauraria]
MLALACLLCNVYMLHDSINMEGKMDFSQYVEGDALALSHTTINTSELVIFLRSRTYITKLSLRYCSIDDTDAEVLAGGNLSHLTLLNLSSNNIGDEGAEALANSKLLGCTKINLDGNIGGQGPNGLVEFLAGGKALTLALLNSDGNNMKDLVNVPRNRQGWTSLHYAVKNGNVGKINDLIKGGKNVDAQDEQGWTPLHLAATGSYTKVVNAQMYGDDIHARETGSEEPIYIKACKNIIESFLDKLLNIKVVGALIKGKAEINAKDNQGMAPLHWAVKVGHINVVNGLIEKEQMLMQ